MTGPGSDTKMAAEIAEIPDVLRRQVIEGLPVYRETGRRLRGAGLRGFVTCARGTSDQAATFFKYIFETGTGLPVASIGPSVASVYNTRLRLEGFAALTFSQSGGSPDLAALQAAARQGNAHTIAILNVTDSPVGEGADTVLPVLAGPEEAVAATKSFIGMLFASLSILAGYRDDHSLESALRDLPDLALEALDSDWSSATVPFARSSSLFCIGRGPSLAIAGEAALKFKETCQLHAEACSAAEVLHGPVAIANARLAALIFGVGGMAGASSLATVQRLRGQGAMVYTVGAVHGPRVLPVPTGIHDLVDPVLQAIAFYRFVEDLAIRIGQNPDAPLGLTKVTRTV